MAARKRIGYVHEFHPNLDHKDWITNQDLTSADPVVQKDVQHWLYGLATPWSDTAVHYVVHPNHAPTSQIIPGEEWVVEYASIFYDFLESVAIAYGSTPQEAITNVDNLVEEAIGKYYIHDEDDDEDDCEETEAEELTGDGRLTKSECQVLKYMYNFKKNRPQPIISNEIEIVAHTLDMDIEKVKYCIRRLLAIGFVVCFREIESLGVAQYELTTSGKLYCEKRFE